MKPEAIKYRDLCQKLLNEIYLLEASLKKKNKKKIKKASKDYDNDGKIESGSDEYLGSRDKAIKKAIAKKKQLKEGTIISDGYNSYGGFPRIIKEATDSIQINQEKQISPSSGNLQNKNFNLSSATNNFSINQEEEVPPPEAPSWYPMTDQEWDSLSDEEKQMYEIEYMEYYDLYRAWLARNRGGLIPALPVPGSNGWWKGIPKKPWWQFWG
jgi:hypothetical protein